MADAWRGIETIAYPFEDAEAARRAVVRNAHAVLAEVRERYPAWEPPPFDPALCAAVLGLPVRYEPAPPDWDGFYIPGPGGARIVLNSEVRCAARRRFSLAHEIVHAWFHDRSGAPLRFRAPRSGGGELGEEDCAASILERCCDAGAAELLMPQPWFGEMLARLGLRAAAVVALAEAFAVSLEAAACRVVEIWGAPCAVGFFEYAARPGVKTSGSGPGAGTPAYRVRRLFRGQGFPFVLPRGKSVPAQSAIYRCSLGGAEIEAVEEFVLQGVRARVAVSACPVHAFGAGAAADGPPTVCAVLAGACGAGGR